MEWVVLGLFCAALVLGSGVDGVMRWELGGGLLLLWG